MNLIVKAGVHGRGVFAGEAIKAGEGIMRFTGPFLRYAQTNAQTYALQIGPDLYIGESGNCDDYVNHSCEPNSGMVIRDTEVNLVAIEDIAEGREILFDYSTTLDEDDFEMPCNCGTAKCRGLVRDGKYLPAAVWERYVKLGVIPGYVRESREKLERGTKA